MLPLSSILAIDQGTHASRAIVFDANGEEVAKSVVEVGLQRRSGGRVEQSAEELQSSVATVVREVLQQVRGHDITACGLATQRSTVLGWCEDGVATSPALSWQDTRGSVALVPLAQHASAIQDITGLPLSAHYGASKLHDLAASEAPQPGDRFSPLVSYLLFHLLEQQPYLVDHCNAQRTQLFDLEQLGWSQQLCDWFGVEPQRLPEIRPVLHDYGCLRGSDIPLTAVSGDQNAAMFGSGALAGDTARINLGTGAFIMRALPQYRSSHRQLSGIAVSSAHDITWMREATINGAGSALAWLAEKYSIADSRAHIVDWLAEIKTPPIYINTVGGLGSPWWQSGIEPHFLEPALTNAERVAAVIESIVFMVQANLVLMRAESELSRLRLSGGLSNLDALCQKLANLSGLVVERGSIAEASARGIAWLAAGQPAHWQAGTEFELFEPQYDSALESRYDTAMEVLQTLITTQEE